MACSADFVLGAVLPFGSQATCHRFDFRIIFEDSFLALAPSLALLPVLALRICIIFRRPKLVDWAWMCKLKLALFAILGVLQLAELGLYTSNHSHITSKTTVSAYAFLFISTVGLALLSALEHATSPRPSAIIQGFLFITLLFNSALLRTRWLLPGEHIMASLLSTAFALQFGLLFVESFSKSSHLVPGRATQFSPEDKAGIFSRSLFLWLNPLFLKGYRRKLVEADLFPIGDELAASKLTGDLDAAWKQTKAARRRRLALALTRAFWEQLFFLHLPRFALVGFAIAQPVLVQSALSYITNHATRPIQSGYGLIGAFALNYICVAVSTAWYQHQTYRLLAMIRGSLIGMIFKHSLRLLVSANDGAAAAVSLISTDVERVIQTLQWSLNIIPDVVQVGLGLWILEMHLGGVCVAPLIAAAICAAVAGIVGRRTPPRQRRWMQAIQKRIKVTTKAVSEIKGIKMSGLTRIVSERIQGLRVSEIDDQKAFRRLQITNIAVGNAPSMITPAITFAAFAIVQRLSSGDRFDVVSAYSSLSLLSILINPISELVMATTGLASALGCLDRIQDFLQREGQQDNRILLPWTAGSEHVGSLPSTANAGTELQPVGDQSLRFHSESPGPIVCIKEGTFGWEPNKPVLRTISLDILPSTFTIVIGPVGSGKSTLLWSLLGEACIISGSVESISPKQTAFCDQEPWIVNASLKQNILGISDYDEKRYRTVVEACQLQQDFAQLPQGDSTLAGSRGLTLSGGQKQRIALARAAYSGKQLIIVDDSLAGLDSATSVKCFHALFGESGLFRRDGRTVVFATHNVQWLPYADQIIILGDQGQIIDRGDLPSLRETSEYLRHPQSTQETRVHVSADLQIVPVGPTDECKESAKATELMVGPSSKDENSAQQPEQPKQQQNKRKKTGALRHYILSLGPGAVCGFFILAVGLIGCNAAQPLWLKYWVTAYKKHPNENVGYWAGIYVLFAVGSILFIAFDTGYFLLLLVPRSATNIHQKLIHATMSVPMSFITAHDTGAIVNHFTGDLNLTDLALPLSFLLASERLLSTVSEVILTCLASGYLALSIPIVVLVLYILQRVYLKTSSRLRVLELELKGPLFSKIISTFDGLATIRAFSWTSAVERESMVLLDSSQRPYYLLFCVQRWLTLVLDLVTAGLATLLMGLAVALQDSIDPGLLGVSLVSVMSFGTVVSELIQNWTSLEMSLGAITRIRNYVDDAPAETDKDEKDVPADWPSRGEIVFSNVYASYNNGTHKVLDNVSLVLKPGSKVAICGRTGSGKSSMIALIPRLLEPDAGSIRIDGVDLADVSPERIRTSLVALPQDPLFLSGSIRLNLDPLEQHSGEDEALLQALEKTGLASLVAEQSELDKELEPEKLSTGQRQLFCMARAMLRKSKILLLDEATSHLDVQTEKIINRLVQTEFRDWTVLVVTHLVKSVADANSGFDQVAVLGNGCIVEHGSPASLLKQHDGVFRKMVDMQH